MLGNESFIWILESTESIKAKKNQLTIFLLEFIFRLMNHRHLGILIYLGLRKLILKKLN